MSIPKAFIYLGYFDVYNENPPEDRLSLIRNFSKEHILYEIVALNYRLKPKWSPYINIKWDNQINELKYFSEIDNNIFYLVYNVAKNYITDKNEYPIIFNRQCCIYAIEEIINDKSFNTIDNFKMSQNIVWENLIKYLLAVNQQITLFHEDEVEDKTISFEILNSKLLPLNELAIESDPVFTPYRGLKLFDYFSKNIKFKNDFKQYFIEKYNISFLQFAKSIIAFYMTNRQREERLEFFYHFNSNDESELLANKLSERISNKDIYKLLSIRKSPFIYVEGNNYILADNIFLMEKIYNQFINDFWFDYLSKVVLDNQNAKYTFKEYRSEFGYFFEDYVGIIFKEIFCNYKYSHLLTFSELRINDKDNLEIADIYFRYNNKIILGQVKSGCIYDNEKYGGDINSLYKNDRNSFFENFGLNQLIKSIENMEKYILKFDTSYQKTNNKTIYPVIIFNDKSLQTPLMADIFNRRFQELLIDIKITKMVIQPVSLIHISDLERMQFSIKKKPQIIWLLLKSNIKDKLFLPPFYYTLNKNEIKINYKEFIYTHFREVLKELEE